MRFILVMPGRAVELGSGWAHMGGVGSGHYVTMVHNGIACLLMQGHAEGFEFMTKSEYNLD